MNLRLASALCLLSSGAHALDLLAIPDPPEVPYELEAGTFKHGSRERKYRYYSPPTKSKALRPLFVVLSGGRGGKLLMRLITRFGIEREARSLGGLVVYPERVEKIWNDGREVPSFTSMAENVDDVGFVKRLIALFKREHRADPSRVYVIGFSNGALMAQRLACEIPDEVAAFVSVAGNIATNVARRCKPGRPVPIMMVHGKEDHFMRWNAKFVHFGPAKLGKKLTVPKNVGFWIDRNGCPKKPRKSFLPDKAKDDGGRVRLWRYGPCREGAEVRLYEISGGGHTWPGGYAWQPEIILGRMNRDMDTSAEAVRFLKRYRLEAR